MPTAPPVSSTEPPVRTRSLAKERIRFLLLEGIHTNAVARLSEAGYSNIETTNTAPSAEQLIDQIRGVHFLGIRSRTQVDARVLAAANRLIGIGAFCIGTDQIDLDAAAAAGIPVFNAPFSNTRSVAELVLAEAILLLRRIPPKQLGLLAGRWQKSADAFEIRGKTLGIIGYGNIGAQLGVLAEGLGMRVIFHDVLRKLRLGNAAQAASLDELLRMADVVSLHVPDDATTRSMIGAAELATMKSTTVLINASRGRVVDHEALATALDEKRIWGAAVDVFPSEPASNDDPFVSPLQSCENVILTPHIGGSTVEAQASIGSEVAEKLIRFSDNGSTLTAVNFPEVQLPAQDGTHRLLHIHQNVPGVMSSITGIFSDLGINIAAQYLQTSAAVGYVVIDLDAEHSAPALARLREIEGTIKTRMLF